MSLEEEKNKVQNSSGRHRTLLRVYSQPAFLICAGVLVAACSVMSVAIEGFSGFFRKAPLPSKKSLELLDESSLAPYQVIFKQKINNKEVVKGLGTEDYIQCTLEDTQVPAHSAVRNCSLFVTYYELPDRVPHVPDECYVGVGYQRLTRDSLTFHVDRAGIEHELAGRCVVFSGTNTNHWRSEKFSVFYLFRVNGVYTGSREATRVALDKNLFGKYSYFSKVEWKFFNTKFGQAIYPSKKEAVKASEKLLAVILPVLEREHWPGWPVLDGK